MEVKQMGLVMKKVKIDSRLEADSAFWDFFADYYTKKKEEEAKKLLEERRAVFAALIGE